MIGLVLKFDGWYHIELVDGRDAIVPIQYLDNYRDNPIKAITEVPEPKQKKLKNGVENG